jgi:hypothetical protein
MSKSSNEHFNYVQQQLAEDSQLDIYENHYVTQALRMNANQYEENDPYFMFDKVKHHES